MRRPAIGRVGGFTLLEVIVVLVIVSLLMTLLTQALWIGTDMLRRSSVEAAAQADESMRLAWYRDLVGGLQPDRDKGPQSFAGQPRRFSGLSAGAPLLDTGAALPVKVELVFDARANRTRLTLTTPAAEQPLDILSWPGEQGVFVYLDEGGRSHPSWPPARLEQPFQLPRAIVLRADLAQSGQALVYAVVSAERNPPDTIVGGLGGRSAR
jgi:general secretion pathway protein J